jgi:hypothetical protein
MRLSVTVYAVPSRLGASDSAVMANVRHQADQEHDDGEWHAP